MTKKIKFFTFVTSIILLFSVLCFGQKWLPYYSFSFSEGVYLPSKGKWGWTTILSNDIGLIVEPATSHAMMCYYQLKYEGPGLKRQEGEKFEQRSMGHTFVLQYNYRLLSNLLLKTRFNYGYDLWRTGTNELWGLGLYDNNRLGFSIEVEHKILPVLKVGLLLGYNMIKFPNYTDLITEYISGAEEVTAGKQDNNMLILSLNAMYKIHNLKFTITNQDYINQKVLSEQGVYSNENQKDLTLNFSYYPQSFVISKILTFTPYVNLRIKDSNQSFLYLQSYDIITSTPTICSDYYDYTKVSISLPFNFYITKTKFLSISPEVEFTSYISREARDEHNNFISGEKQKNFLTLYSFIYTSQSEDKQRKVSLFYTYYQQVSNMKFEKYYPYNYTGHYFGVRFNYSY